MKLNCIEELKNAIKDMRENPSKESPLIAIDVNDRRVVLIGEMEDKSFVRMDEFENGVKIEEERSNRQVTNVLINQLDFFYDSLRFKDEKGIFLMHVDNIESDMSKLNHLVYNADLVLVILNNRVYVYKDVNPVIDRIYTEEKK